MTAREQSADRGARVGAELRALAEAATPGPWWTTFYAGGERLPATFVTASHGTRSGTVALLDSDDSIGWGNPRREHDAALIAAANPATVLALLDRLEAAEFAQAHFEREYESACEDIEHYRSKVERVEALADLWAASDVPTDQMRADDIRHALRGALGEQGATSAEVGT